MKRSAGVAAAGAIAWAAWRATRPRADLRGEVVAITGGSRGLGLLLAEEFAAHGCRLATCARDEQELRRAEARLTASGAEVLALPCDVSLRDHVDRWVAAVRERYGRIDVLVNNASVIQVAPLAAMTVDDFEDVIAINFLGGMYATMAVMPEMRERRAGRIVNVTSIGGKVPVPHLLPYDAAKFAMVGFSEGLRAELAKDGVSVTTIVPGLMRTGSPVNAFFKGPREAEYTWFSLGDATPITAMSARRAARRIVLATRRGEAEVTLTWQAKLLRLAHGVAPGVVTDAMGLANRMLPEGGRGSSPTRGMELATPLSPSPLTAMMNRAARQNNEYGGKPTPSARHAEQVGLEERR